tara:strand:- start:1013 stop:1144 length:132 start_codon:yes stop_codon:yes gene_type:complete
VLEIINFILIGEFFFLENLIKDFKFVPRPEINTAVEIKLFPVN